VRSPELVTRELRCAPSLHHLVQLVELALQLRQTVGVSFLFLDEFLDLSFLRCLESAVTVIGGIYGVPDIRAALARSASGTSQVMAPDEAFGSPTLPETKSADPDLLPAPRNAFAHSRFARASCHSMVTRPRFVRNGPPASNRDRLPLCLFSHGPYPSSVHLPNPLFNVGSTALIWP
jgi:hypothetical protein